MVINIPRNLSFEGGRKAFFYVNETWVEIYCDNNHDYPLFVSIVVDYQQHLSRWYFSVENDSFYEDLFLKTSLKDLKNIRFYLEANSVLKSVSDIKSSYLAFRVALKNLMHISGLIRNLDRGVSSFFSKNYNSNFLDELSVSSEESIALKKEKALLLVAKGEGSLKDFYERYAWLDTSYYKEQPKTIGYYQDLLKDLSIEEADKKLSFLESQRKKSLDKQEIAFKKLKLDHEYLKKFVPLLIHLKDFKKECTNKLIYNSEKIFLELAKIFQKSVDEVKDLSQEETLALLEGKSINWSLVNLRSESSIGVGIPGRKPKFIIERSVDLRKTLFYKDSELKGRMTISKSAEGKARIINSDEDLKKLLVGDIAVVINTNPDFVPYLKNINGIVAEEGGITAHVAVISREFNIAAIIGVKDATKILKDGDKIKINHETKKVEFL